jgi:hypothetical protein
MGRRENERSQQRNKNSVLVFFITGIVLVLTLSFSFASQSSGKRLVPLSLLALIAGVLFEGRRLSQKWSTVLGITLGSLVMSLLAFLPGRREVDYQIGNHIEIWPYWFIILFALISIATHGDKVVPRLTEGITLLQSIAVTYWVIDFGLFSTDSYFLKALMGIGIMFSLYSLFHAFTYTSLTKGGRLTLSLWSSMVMLLFAFDNVYRIYQNEQIENAADISHAAYVALEFFLLGISAIYIIQNFLMLMGFLPGKGTFFNAQYFRDVRELNRDHISRYSDRQVSIGHSLLCAISTIAAFALNHYYQILPRHLAIWAVFVLFPFLLSVFATRLRDIDMGMKRERV